MDFDLLFCKRAVGDGERKLFVFSGLEIRGGVFGEDICHYIEPFCIGFGCQMDSIGKSAISDTICRVPGIYNFLC